MDEDRLIPVSQCGVEIPEYLDKAILKGLAVQPEDRFQPAAECLEAIENQQVVEVKPQVQEKEPPIKKVPAALIGGAAAVVVLAAGGAGYLA